MQNSLKTISMFTASPASTKNRTDLNTASADGGANGANQVTHDSILISSIRTGTEDSDTALDAEGSEIALLSGDCNRNNQSEKVNNSESGLGRGTSWFGSIASVETAGITGTTGTTGTVGDGNDSDISSLTRSAVSIQRILKGYLTRRIVSKMLCTRLMRVFSLEANRGLC